jgi:hypothetical protein
VIPTAVAHIVCGLQSSQPWRFLVRVLLARARLPVRPPPLAPFRASICPVGTDESYSVGTIRRMP